MIVFARGLVVSPYARDMSSMIFTNTYRPDTSSGRRMLTICCMTEEHDLSARARRVVTESLDRHRIYEPDAHGINLSIQYHHSGAPVMVPTALRHPIFSLSHQLSVAGDSLPRGLNWPIKALSTFRGLAHPPWTT